MISELSKYGAVYGKIKALHGYRLMPEDFRKMSTMHSVSDIAAYLKNTPGWGKCLKDAQISSISRGALESALRSQFLDEFIRIYKFLEREDGRIAGFPILQVEMEQILTALRAMRSAHMQNFILPLTTEIRMHSKIDFNKLAMATNYQMLLEAVKNTIFYAPLTHAANKSLKELPDYMQTELVVQTAYYKELFTAIKNQSKRVRETLERYFGEEIDMLTIVRIWRLKKSFSNLANDTFTYLLPFIYRLKPGVIRELFNCHDEKAMFAVLKTTHYKKVFGDFEFRNIEDYYQRAIYIKNKKMLSEGFPSVLTAIAYLNLKRIELANVTHVVECVRYGLDPEVFKMYITSE